MKLTLILEERAPASNETFQCVTCLEEEDIDNRQAIEDALFRVRYKMTQKLNAFRRNQANLP